MTCHTCTSNQNIRSLGLTRCMQSCHCTHTHALTHRHSLSIYLSLSLSLSLSLTLSLSLSLSLTHTHTHTHMHIHTGLPAPSTSPTAKPWCSLMTRPSRPALSCCRLTGSPASWAMACSQAASSLWGSTCSLGQTPRQLTSPSARWVRLLNGDDGLLLVSYGASNAP